MQAPSVVPSPQHTSTRQITHDRSGALSLVSYSGLRIASKGAGATSLSKATGPMFACCAEVSDRDRDLQVERKSSPLSIASNTSRPRAQQEKLRSK